MTAKLLSSTLFCSVAAIAQLGESPSLVFVPQNLDYVKREDAYRLRRYHEVEREALLSVRGAQPADDNAEIDSSLCLAM